MGCSLTPASRRAVDAANIWAIRADCSELIAPALLLGLLAERECRAATMLARCGIDTSAVCRRWPNLAQINPIGGEPKTPQTEQPTGGTDVLASASCGEHPVPLRLSAEVEAAFELARQRMADLPQPLELATEHILCGLAAADHETAVWLRQEGLDPDTLDAEIHRLYGLPTLQVGEKDDIAVLRVLDAAVNRAREAIRVVEDYVRFVLDDRHLTGLCKQLRHDMTAAMARIPERHRLAARETLADVGTVLTTSAEQRRENAASLPAANFARLQEALRSLEEFGKVVDGDLATAMKQLRYRAYTLQRAVENQRQSIQRLASARLYVLIDGRPTIEEFCRLATSLIDAGVHVLQFRDKRLGDRELLARARLLGELTAGRETLLIINDRPDLARLARADGVHVGQEELSAKDVRTIAGPEMLVGVSAHSIEQARQAVLDGANYLGVGPTFPSSTKPFERFPGVELLRAVAAEIRLPAFAIGGIERSNVGEVLAAGFTRAAVSAAVCAAADPTAAARDLLAALNSV